MPLYEVRKMDVQPGGFDNALVIAAGSMLARKAVAHLNGGSVKGLVAEKVPTVVKADNAQLLSAYWDERTPLTQDDAETGTMSLYAEGDEYYGDVSRPGDFNF